jgi:endogenous inhibitor of DNA gyrase (YacG/DUF329 family)
MEITKFESARKVGAPCLQCGREFWRGKRNGRKRRFCSNACRQAYFRNAEWDRRYQASDPLRNAENSAEQSIACSGQNRGRAFPVDLVGGGSFRWPGSGLDPELVRKILAVELAGPLRGTKR